MTAQDQLPASFSPSPMPFNVFVYGTLKPGEFYYPLYCEGKVVQSCEAFTYGQLYDLPLGYPAMTVGQARVYGYVLTFVEAQALKDLDDLEGYDPHGPLDQNEYERQQIEAFHLDGTSLGMVWAYRMTVQHANHLGGTLISSGRWTGKPA